MKRHPAILMLWTWALCAGLFSILPFHIINRQISTYGFVILFLFILAFCAGAFLKTPPIAQRRASLLTMPNFERADYVIAVVATIAILTLLIDLRNGSGGDLSASWLVRDDRAGAILSGRDSGSSLTFQIGFMTSPIAYIAIAREVIFGARIRYGRLLLFGFGPLLASSLALGGRGPLLFALTMFGFAMLVRRYIGVDPGLPATRRRLSGRQVFFGIIMTVVGLASLNYFVEVFNVRAEGSGGTAALLYLAGDSWGVSFEGPTADAMVTILGAGNTYLIFVFSWYLCQGLIISNELFTTYTGPPMLGLYGIEVVIAIARRINPQFVSEQFYYISDLNAFGFVASAFGTLFVDYWLFGIVIAAIWGYLASHVYLRARTSSDGRWLLVVPFIVQGIIFSLINTPFGLTNGLVTHLWLLLIFLLARPRRVASAQLDAARASL